MPLTLPTADERTFASLIGDARARIPRLAPDWTDHNAHDPGITLLELFAYLTETDLYRLGRITAAQQRAFLRWFGLDAGGPTVAETVVAFEVPPSAGALSVATDLEFASAPGDVVFSTIAPVTVQPAGIAGLFEGERRLFATTVPSQEAVLDAAATAFGPSGKDPFTIALDQPAAGDVSLYLWTGAADHDDGVRRRLQEEAAAVARDRSGVERPCPPSRFDDWRRHYEVDIAWEVFTASGWAPASVVEDQTRALSLSGFVRLRVDQALVAGALAAASTAFALRARPTRGRYEAPPVLRAVLLNAAPARHQSRTFSIRLGSSNGRAGQVFRVPRGTDVPTPGAPLVFDRTEVTITPATGAGVRWTIATDWDRAGPAARMFVLDADAAEVRFGDGRLARVPPTGAFVDLVSRVGGGAGGNVPSRTLSGEVSAAGQAKLKVFQPFAARGGGSAPELPDLQARLLADLARPTRAATLADFELLTLEAPGVPVGRVRAVPEHHPAFPGLPAPGCVTVVVVPKGPGSRLEPTPGLLAAVRAYLSRRRPVTTELHVIAPTYSEVAVRAHLYIGPYTDAETVKAEAARRLDGFFHPLTGGTGGGGWPIGRDVYRSEVLALLQEVPGVHHVDELSLLVGPQRSPLCENVPVCPTDLVASNPHELTIAPTRIR